MTQFLGNEIFNFYYLPAKTRNYVDELKSFDDVSNPEYVFWATRIPKKCVIRVRVQPGKAKTDKEALNLGGIFLERRCPCYVRYCGATTGNCYGTGTYSYGTTDASRDISSVGIFRLGIIIGSCCCLSHPPSSSLLGTA
jgi:hypothetical protein